MLHRGAVSTIFKVFGMTYVLGGLEPKTSCTQSKHSTTALQSPF